MDAVPYQRCIKDVAFENKLHYARIRDKWLKDIEHANKQSCVERKTKFLITAYYLSTTYSHITVPPPGYYTKMTGNIYH